MICDRIREERKNAGFTQEEVADHLGIDRSTYAYYESGKIKVPLSIIDKIADLFQISRTFYLESPRQSFSFSSDDILSLSEDQKDELEKMREQAYVYSPFTSEFKKVGEVEAEEDSIKSVELSQNISPDEMSILAKFRILKQAGLRSKICDILDEMLENIPDNLIDTDQ